MCIAGECDRACESGYGDCDSDLATGCETAVNSITNCGACGRACASGELCASGVCRSFAATAPPVLQAPLSGGRVTRRRPTLRWRYAAGAPTMAEVQVCRTRVCSDASARTYTVSGDRFVPPLDLPVGVHYWRLRAYDGTRAADTYSNAWEFRVMPGTERGEAPVGYDADFNGDGYADVAVGGSNPDMGRGSVSVYYGSATGLAATAAWTMAAAPDSGPVTCLGSGMGHGDFNGDGFTDLAIGDNCAAFSMGRVYIFAGGPMGLGRTVAGTLAGPDGRSAFGERVSGAGDVNNDGFADLIVGAPLTGTATIIRSGAAHVYYGNAAGMPTLAWSARDRVMERARVGRDVGGVGDVNGDGYADVFTGAPGDEETTSYAMGFLSGPTGLPLVQSVRYDDTGIGRRLGIAITAAGDVNGDGYADVLTGGYGANMDAGYAWLLLGSRDGFPRAAAEVFTGTVPGEGVGHFLSGGDDTDGDGFSEIVIGRRCTPHVYRGRASGVDTMNPIRLMDDAGMLDTLCNLALAMPGDVDGDGFGDVVVGSQDFADRNGAVAVYRGRAEGLDPRPAAFRRGTGMTGYFAGAFSR